VNRFRSGDVIRAGIGVAVSIVAFVIVLRSVDIADTLLVLARATPAWIAVALAAVAADAMSRAARWQRLLAPIHAVRYRNVLRYTLIGYLANNVLPARLGELVRSHYLGDREGLSRTTTLGTVVVERLVDTVMAVLIAAAAVVILGIGGVIATAVVVGGAVAGAFALALVLGLAAHRLPGASRLIALGARWPRVAELVGRLRGGLSVAARPRTLIAAVLLSAIAWAWSTAAFAATGQAVGLTLSPAQAALVVSGTALATAIPSGPGYLGTFELAAVRILQALGVASDAALAFALLAHATILVATSAGGAIALAQVGWQGSGDRSG
jgi:glycosyltransferase 2 family protein